MPSKISKTCILFASPRKQGNTASLLSPFMETLRDSGAEIQYFDVYERQISGCKACLWCQKDTDAICCIQEDEMQPILRAVSDSDLIVLASPIYIWSAPAPLKAVIDRLVYAACKYYGDDPHGPSLLQGKKLALLCTCGYPVSKGADLYEEEMKRFCKHVQMYYLGMLCERQRNLKETFMDEAKKGRAQEFGREVMKAL